MVGGGGGGGSELVLAMSIHSMIVDICMHSEHWTGCDRSFDTCVGWDLAWIDGVTAEIMKKRLDTSAAQCKEVVRDERKSPRFLWVLFLCFVVVLVLNFEVCSVSTQVEYLSSLGIPTHRMENMISISKQIFGRTSGELANVVSFLESKGLGGDELVQFLEEHPVVLTYSVSPSNEYLEKGKARISLVKVNRDGAVIPGIVQWREGAVFSSSPVSPYLPSQ